MGEYITGENSFSLLLGFEDTHAPPNQDFMHTDYFPLNFTNRSHILMSHFSSNPLPTLYSMIPSSTL